MTRLRWLFVALTATLGWTTVVWLFPQVDQGGVIHFILIGFSIIFGVGVIAAAIETGIQSPEAYEREFDHER